MKQILSIYCSAMRTGSVVYVSRLKSSALNLKSVMGVQPGRICIMEGLLYPDRVCTKKAFNFFLPLFVFSESELIRIMEDFWDPDPDGAQ